MVQTMWGEEVRRDATFHAGLRLAGLSPKAGSLLSFAMLTISNQQGLGYAAMLEPLGSSKRKKTLLKEVLF